MISLFHLKFVAHTPDCLYIFALVSHLVPELLDMGIYGSGVSKIVVVPYIVQDLFSGKSNPLLTMKY